MHVQDSVWKRLLVLFQYLGSSATFYPSQVISSIIALTTGIFQWNGSLRRTSSLALVTVSAFMLTAWERPTYSP